jgi:transcriptional regulator with GAF, ATPase, and Fis domain
VTRRIPNDVDSNNNTTPELESRQAAPPEERGLFWVHPRELFVPFTRNTLTIGRGQDCGAVLPSEHVSRVHALVRRIGPLFVLSDAGSRNGTFRNGQQVSESPLELGDVVRAGDWIGVVIELPRSLLDSANYFEELEDGVIVGPRSRAEWSRLKQVAGGRLPILLEGPTGTGKEVFARALHRRSQRSGAFIGVNCAALPESLAEAQLFGHARGAYTGAVQATEGLIAAADRGTLLLDELADLPASQQAKLLRVIEEGEVVRLGETAARSIDVRFVAACQFPLWDLVQRGTFRADLLARLSGCTLRLAPLRDRREEIPRLFARAFAAAGGEPRRLKAGAIEALCLAPWPFNVRQLLLSAENAATSLPKDGEIGRGAIAGLLAAAGPAFGGAGDAPLQTENSIDPTPALGRRRSLWLARHRPQLEQLLAALEENGGNVSEAARETGLSRSAAARLLEVHASLKQPGQPRS